MYIVSINFEFITFNSFINLFILLKNCIDYIQVKCIENSMEKCSFRNTNVTFPLRVELHITLKISITVKTSRLCN